MKQFHRLSSVDGGYAPTSRQHTLKKSWECSLRMLLFTDFRPHKSNVDIGINFAFGEYGYLKD
jgi:hypothetical protein